LDFLILDATAFIGGLNLNLIKSNSPNLIIITTSGVFDEAIRNPKAEQMIEIAQAQNSLQVRDPTPEFQQKVREQAVQSGDVAALSQNDKDLIALVLGIKTEYPDKHVALMSDDYSVQNVCKVFNIQIFQLRHQGIKKHVRWEIYCPSCFRVYSPSLLGKECEVCGVVLKRRPYRGKKGHL
jgi:rRNA maturation endonuclease Nob1